MLRYFLEAQTKAELKDALRGGSSRTGIDLSRDLSKARRVEHSGRDSILCVIQNVEAFATKIESKVIRPEKLFVYSHIDLPGAGSAQEISRSIPESSSGRKRKCRGVKSNSGETGPSWEWVKHRGER